MNFDLGFGHLGDSLSALTTSRVNNQQTEVRKMIIRLSIDTCNAPTHALSFLPISVSSLCLDTSALTSFFVMYHLLDLVLTAICRVLHPG
jgi:hypothetical protein